MNKIIKTTLIFLLLFFTLTLNAIELEFNSGLHDFVVSDIKDDGALGHIESGTSHTFGLNMAIVAKYKTESNINIFAKAEVFLDFDKDKLDPDHIPIWFDFLLDIDGDIYMINKYNYLKWYVYADNKQNTVSCIEREIRQQYGVGWEYNRFDFSLGISAMTGFYYIEIDDDTPVSRGYNRLDLDDGEAANRLQIELSYDFTKRYSFYGYINQYSANAGMEDLEQNIEVLLKYKIIDSFLENASLNFRVKYSKYSFDRFNTKTVNALPWDNDTLIQVYASFPIAW